MKKTFIKKLIAYGLLLTAISVGVFFLLESRGSRQVVKDAVKLVGQGPEIEYYTCGMHPSVRVSPQEYNEGKTTCPICNMNLIPVYAETAKAEEETYYGCGVDTQGKCPKCDLGKPSEECICGEHSFVIKGEKINCPVCGASLRELTKDEADKLRGVVSRVAIKGGQLQLAGIGTEPVSKLHLYKKLRTVGRVAYDPQLAVAEEEFISALNTLDKIKEGGISEIKERAINLVNSSKRKLLLLGLSEEEIRKLEEKGEIHTSLILPGEKMWIYGDVYEYELPWIKIGEGVIVTTSSLPGEEFYGVISSLNPVLDPKTRSLRFRAEVENPQLRLRPEMYVDVVIQSMYRGPKGAVEVLAIPKEAVLDTGVRKIVWVEKGAGKYEGRLVRIGQEASAKIGEREDKFYPVLNGLREGEKIVTKANFLVDSQSQISGVAAAAYGGALGIEEKKAPPTHQH